MKLPKYIFLATLLVGLTSSLSAQKFGYLNSTLLLGELSAVQSANSQLEAFQTQLMKKGEGMVKSLETNYTAYVQQANSGTLSKVQMQEKETKLNQQREEIARYEQDVQTQILKKREELLSPILNKVDEAIKAVGKENGYQFIFDTSAGQLLYGQESDDVTSLVKAKL